MDRLAHLRGLNVAQRAAVEYGVSDIAGADVSGPLLVIAGAGTGKTSTLAHRAAHLIVMGTPSERILLLSFTRRDRDDEARPAYPFNGMGCGKVGSRRPG
jgi:DNA helicase-2/ATP-dependent DNA helicase PcrA